MILFIVVWSILAFIKNKIMSFLIIKRMFLLLCWRQKNHPMNLFHSKGLNLKEQILDELWQKKINKKNKPARTCFLESQHPRISFKN